VEAVLFDMDGVLVSSDGISRLAARDVLREMYGIDVDPDEFLKYTGMGEGVFLSSVARSYGVEIDVARTKARFFEVYLASYCTGEVNIGFPGAVELVSACKGEGLRVAVASAADLVKVEGNLRAAGMALDMFDAVVSADQFEGKLKPHPDIFLAAAARLGVAPERCVVIEDALAGVEAACRAGMRVIGVTTTLGEEALLGAAHVPDLVRGEIGEITLRDVLECGV
jgi:beta-phosphoglucomutase-like phosphatase (HAD superfamily)